MSGCLTHLSRGLRMFQTVITADLPSQETPGAAPADDDFAPAHDRVLLSAARLLTMMKSIFDAAEIVQVAYVTIDGDVLFEDPNELSTTDLDDVLGIARDEGYLNREFNAVRIGLARWEKGLQHIIEVHARMAVPVGEHELVIRVASRPDDFNARRLDDAERYASRLLEYAADLDAIARYRLNVQEVIERIHESLQRHLFRRELSIGRVMLRILRPTGADLQSMNHLVFGETIVPPRARSLPMLPDGAWDDPSLRVYDDPYLVFRNWVFLHALMVERFLRVEWVEVAEPTGKHLFLGHKAKWFENWPWAQKFDVDLIDEGGVVVTFIDGGPA